MTNCTDCRTLLVDYERGELDPARDAAVYAHLQSCDDCRALWHADLAVVDGLRSWGAEHDFPTSVLAVVRQAMRGEPAPSLFERLRVIWRPAVAAPIAAAVLIAGGVIGYHRSHVPQATLTGMDYVREHVAQTAGMGTSDRTWSTYLLTSANAGGSVDAVSSPTD